MILRFRRIIVIQDTLLSEIYFQQFSNGLNISNYYYTNPLTTWSTTDSNNSHFMDGPTSFHSNNINELGTYMDSS